MKSFIQFIGESLQHGDSKKYLDRRKIATDALECKEKDLRSLTEESRGESAHLYKTIKRSVMANGALRQGTQIYKLHIPGVVKEKGLLFDNIDITAAGYLRERVKTFVVESVGGIEIFVCRSKELEETTDSQSGRKRIPIKK
jgi:hypothetical protein